MKTISWGSLLEVVILELLIIMVYDRRAGESTFGNLL